MTHLTVVLVQRQALDPAPGNRYRPPRIETFHANGAKRVCHDSVGDELASVAATAQLHGAPPLTADEVRAFCDGWRHNPEAQPATLETIFETFGDDVAVVYCDEKGTVTQIETLRPVWYVRDWHPDSADYYEPMLTARAADLRRLLPKEAERIDDAAHGFLDGTDIAGFWKDRSSE